MPQVTRTASITGMAASKFTPFQRIIVHPTPRGWSWTRVSRNGSAGAVAPSPFDNKSNAVRAGRREAAVINRFSAVTVAVVEVRDTDPGYV